MKWLIGIIVAVGLVLGAAFLFLNQIVAGAIETGSALAFGVETEVDSVSVRPFAGRFELRGLVVANPGGYETPYFLRLDAASLDLPVANLWNDPIVIPRLELQGIHLNLERGSGGMNYAAILERMDAGETSGGTSTDVASSSGSAQAGPGVLVRDVAIRDVGAHVQLSPVAKELTAVDVSVPEIRMSDVGSDKAGGVPQVVTAITRAVLKAVVQKSGDLPASLTRDLSSRLGGIAGAAPEAGEGLRDLGSSALEGIKGLMRRDD